MNQIHKRTAILDIKHYEERFSANHYNGKGKKDYIIKKGNIPIMISAPHATNHTREANIKHADMLTGGIGWFLQKETGCHLMITTRQSGKDPNYDEAIEGDYKTRLLAYVKENNIKLLIDLHGASSERDYAVEMGTADEEDRSLHQYKFITSLIAYTFDYHFKDLPEKKEVWKNKLFGASGEHTITNYISKQSDTACVQLEINGLYRDFSHEDRLYSVIVGLTDIITQANSVDWNAKTIKVFRAAQSGIHKPQDKIEIAWPDADADKTESQFDNHALLHISVKNHPAQQVRWHSVAEKTKQKNEVLFQCDQYMEYVFLTNRLIHCIFRRDWIDENEEQSGIAGKPVIVYQNDDKQYKIGLPSASKIDNITVSSRLYHSMKQERIYDYLVYNKYADIRMHLNFEKANYDDKGRLKNEVVMVPRYYKSILGYLDYPLVTIRKEEYHNMLERLDDEQKCVFTQSYEAVGEETFLKLRAELTHAQRESLIAIQKDLKLLDSIQILKIPKYLTKRELLIKTMKELPKQLATFVLNFYVGYAEYMLRATWTNDTDDKNDIARLSPNLMNLLGVCENDKIDVVFGNSTESLRVLAGEFDAEYYVGIPAQARQRLGMNSVNDVVIVKRNMWHTFMRHSVQQGITFLGTLLTVFELVNDWRWRIVVGIITFAIMIYWVLSEERIRVK